MGVVNSTNDNNFCLQLIGQQDLMFNTIIKQKTNKKKHKHIKKSFASKAKILFPQEVKIFFLFVKVLFAKHFLAHQKKKVFCYIKMFWLSQVLFSKHFSFMLEKFCLHIKKQAKCFEIQNKKSKTFNTKQIGGFVC